MKKRKGTVAKPAMKNDNSSAYYESGFSMGDDNYFGVDVYGNQNSSLFQPNEPALPPTNEFLSDLFSAEDINGNLLIEHPRYQNLCVFFANRNGHPKHEQRH